MISNEQYGLLADSLIALDDDLKATKDHLRKEQDFTVEQVAQMTAKLDTLAVEQEKLTNLVLQFTQQMSEWADLAGKLVGLKGGDVLNQHRVGERLSLLEGRGQTNNSEIERRLDGLEHEMASMWRIMPEIKPVTTSDIMDRLRASRN